MEELIEQLHKALEEEEVCKDALLSLNDSEAEKQGQLFGSKSTCVAFYTPERFALSRLIDATLIDSKRMEDFLARFFGLCVGKKAADVIGLVESIQKETCCYDFLSNLQLLVEKAEPSLTSSDWEVRMIQHMKQELAGLVGSSDTTGKRTSLIVKKLIIKASRATVYGS